MSEKKHPACQNDRATDQKQDHRRRVWLCWLAPLTGFFALLWFLIRVIPKPSRAAYPCQRVAFPLASSFVIWLIGLAVAIKSARFIFKGSRFARAFLFVGLVVVAISVPLSYSSFVNDGSWYSPSDPPLTPLGTPRGIHPGRVVWNYNPNATSWNGTTGYWYNAIDQIQVDKMLSTVLKDLAGADSDANAWDQLFRHYNQNHSKGVVGYQANEKIVVKLNLNGMSTANHTYAGNGQLTAPQVVLALLRQLVNQAGVNATNITFYDASRYIPNVIYDRCKAEFPGVHFADFSGGDGREQVQKDLVNGRINWSDDLQNPTEVGKSGLPSYLPTCVTGADYFINLGNLKGHSLAGVTFCAKNLFGSFICDPSAGGSAIQMPKNAGIHPYIVANDQWPGTIGVDSWAFVKRPMGSYNALVDLMGDANLGGKTLLYLIDGLYAMNNQSISLSVDCKWQNKPFSDNSGWSSSLFASQDPVAIDSVALDFLRSEPTIQEYNHVMDAGNTVDNFLHEASQANNPPSGAFYDPESDTVRMTSLGVHEHWNNSTEKRYSGNTTPGAGIELIGRIILPDLDRDGLSDAWELLYYGGPTNANPAALCSNGMDSVMTAYIAGFSPTNPLARFTITDLQANTPDTICWGGVSGRVYSVYWSTNLLSGFQCLESNLPWTCESLINTQHQGNAAGFYKVNVELENP